MTDLIEVETITADGVEELQRQLLRVLNDWPMTAYTVAIRQAIGAVSCWCDRDNHDQCSATILHVGCGCSCHWK